MEWYDFLREERARKLENIKQLSSGNVRITVRTDGELRDVSDEMVADDKSHVAEIEEILTKADQPLS